MENQECESEEITKYGKKSIQECADACKGVSSMFVFDNMCTSICGCYCEIGANSNGTCSMKAANFYNLYRYVGGKNYCSKNHSCSKYYCNSIILQLLC